MKISRRTFTQSATAWALAMARVSATQSATANTAERAGSDISTRKVDVAGGTLELTAVSESIIHVVFTPHGVTSRTLQFAVLPGMHPAASFTEHHDGTTLTLTTKRVTVKVSTTTGVIQFLDSKGDVLLREADGNGWPVEGPKKFVKTTVNGEQTFNVTNVFLPVQDEAFYGLGQQQSGLMNLRGAYVPLRQVNTDVSIPVMVSTRGYGMFWNNPSPGNFDNSFPSLFKWNSQVGESIDYYFFYGPTMDEVIAGYRELTGRVPMFPKWAYGFFQSKDHYENAEEVLDIAAEYRRRRIPLDVIVQDWRWWITQGEGAFRQNYGDPEAMMKELHARNIHCMLSVWPYYDEEGHGPYREQMQREGAFVSGTTLVDVSSAAARKVYWSQIERSLLPKGFDAWWLDAAEPEFYGQSDTFLANRDISIGSGARYASIYPLLHTTGVSEGLRHASPTRRVFILARSAYAGQQRNGVTTWSGDTQGTFWAFSRQIPAGLNFMLSGFPNWTTDIGGYGFPDAPDTEDPAYQELFLRWFQYGVFCPIFRVHGRRANNRNEIYSFTAVENILTDYDRLRYRLMPYIYSLAARVNRDHYTMMRPLVMDWPNDHSTWSIGDQFTFGPSLLVNPILAAGARERLVYLPAGSRWYDFWSGAAYPGGQQIEASAPLEKIPLFVRAGSILPIGPPIEYAMEGSDPITLRIYGGADAEFNLYDDEGDGYGYERGQFSLIPLTWDEASQTFTIGARQGSYPGVLEKRTFQIVWADAGRGWVSEGENPAQLVSYTGEEITIHRTQ